MSEQEINAFRRGFTEALTFAGDTGWDERQKMGAMAYLDTLIKVEVTGEKENFFDAIRNATDMSEDQKAYWLGLEYADNDDQETL